jgi:hypothetical protein
LASTFRRLIRIKRDNKDKRQHWALRGFHQFDAPVCVIVT